MFDYVHPLEFPFIHWIQGFRTPLLDLFFKLWNLVDTPYFIFILFPTVWLGWNWLSGARVYYLISLSGLINASCKVLFNQPRPFMLEPGLNLVQMDSVHGFPSGAAQSSVIFAYLIISTYRTPLAWLLGVLCFFLLSLSRIYLGVHFPTDLVGGWILGAVLVTLYHFSHLKIESALEKMALSRRFFVSQIFPLITFVIALYFGLKSPAHISLSAMAVGFGLCLSARQKTFLPDPTTWLQTLFRSLVGAVGIFVIFLLPISTYIQAPLIGFWLSYLSSRVLHGQVVETKRSGHHDI